MEVTVLGRLCQLAEPWTLALLDWNAVENGFRPALVDVGLRWLEQAQGDEQRAMKPTVR